MSAAPLNTRVSTASRASLLHQLCASQQNLSCSLQYLLQTGTHSHIVPVFAEMVLTQRQLCRMIQYSGSSRLGAPPGIWHKPPGIWLTVDALRAPPVINRVVPCAPVNTKMDADDFVHTVSCCAQTDIAAPPGVWDNVACTTAQSDSTEFPVGCSDILNNDRLQSAVIYTKFDITGDFENRLTYAQILQASFVDWLCTDITLDVNLITDNSHDCNVYCLCETQCTHSHDLFTAHVPDTSITVDSSLEADVVCLGYPITGNTALYHKDTDYFSAEPTYTPTCVDCTTCLANVPTTAADSVYLVSNTLQDFLTSNLASDEAVNNYSAGGSLPDFSIREPSCSQVPFTLRSKPLETTTTVDVQQTGNIVLAGNGKLQCFNGLLAVVQYCYLSFQDMVQSMQQCGHYAFQYAIAPDLDRTEQSVQLSSLQHTLGTADGINMLSVTSQSPTGSHSVLDAQPTCADILDSGIPTTTGAVPTLKLDNFPFMSEITRLQLLADWSTDEQSFHVRSFPNYLGKSKRSCLQLLENGQCIAELRFVQSKWRLFFKHGVEYFMQSAHGAANVIHRIVWKPVHTEVRSMFWNRCFGHACSFESDAQLDVELNAICRTSSTGNLHIPAFDRTCMSKPRVISQHDISRTQRLASSNRKAPTCFRSPKKAKQIARSQSRSSATAR